LKATGEILKEKVPEAIEGLSIKSIKTRVNNNDLIVFFLRSVGKEFAAKAVEVGQEYGKEALEAGKEKGRRTSS